MLIALASVDLAEVLFIYPHGFPIGARGLGWPVFPASIAIWAVGLAYCPTSVFSTDRR
jgi:hypothetical protein